MSRQLPNLWNVNFTEATRADWPVSLLREQAEYLRESTGGVVTAVVTSGPLGIANEDVIHAFRLVVPALGNYEYTLFRVVSGPAPYPVTIRWDDQEFPANDRGDLQKHLRRIFNAPGTTEIITNLMQIAANADT